MPEPLFKKIVRTKKFTGWRRVKLTRIEDEEGKVFFIEKCGCIWRKMGEDSLAIMELRKVVSCIYHEGKGGLRVAEIRES